MRVCGVERLSAWPWAALPKQLPEQLWAPVVGAAIGGFLRRWIT